MVQQLSHRSFCYHMDMLRTHLGSRLAVGIVTLFGAVLLAHAQTASPLAPTGVTITFSPPSHITVSWSAPVRATGVAGYYIYRNGSIAGNARGQTFTDTVPPGTYTYMVAGYDAMNHAMMQSAPSKMISVVADTVDPARPTGLTAVAGTSSVALAWLPSTDNVGVVGYYIYRNNMRIVTPNTISGTNYTDAGMPGGTAHTYAVTAYDATGNTSAASAPIDVTTILDTMPPAVPVLKSVVATSSSEIDVTWASTTDNVAVAGYYLYRNNARIVTLNASTTFFADRNLAARTTYHYTLAAYDTTGNIASSSLGMATTTFPPDTTPPTVPSDIVVANLMPRSLIFTWSPSRDDVGVAGYKIYRNQQQIATVATSSYADTNLASSTTYGYGIVAYDKAGNVSLPGTFQIKTPLVAAKISPVVASSSLPTTARTVSSSTPAKFIFTETLRVGQSGGSVNALQVILIRNGYLGLASTTAVFDVATQKALQKFQCVVSIVCSGSPSTTGWGMVGAKTRKALNALP